MFCLDYIKKYVNNFLFSRGSEADDDINDLNKKIDELDKSMKENKEKPKKRRRKT